MSVYKKLQETLEEILPEGWKFTEYEPLQDLPDVTGLTMKVREVRRIPQAPGAGYEVDWVVTVTSPNTSRETADPQLFDDLINLLIALDTLPDLSWLTWTEATKVVGDDLERLAYDITIRIITEKDEA
jgi:hypothetical protein